MKYLAVLAFLGVSVMVVLIYQAVNQEMNLKSLKSRMAEDSAAIKSKEQAIINIKNTMQDMNNQVASLNSKKDDLTKKKDTITKATQEIAKNLQTCNTERGEAEKKKAELTVALAKLKTDHEEAKKKPQEEIQKLKQQILDRDKAICAFVDKAKEEGRKLCGITDASH